MKQCVKALGKINGRGKIPNIAQSKLNEGIFVGLQNRKVLQVVNFKTTVDELELPVWNAFTFICKDFLGNKKAMVIKNYLN